MLLRIVKMVARLSRHHTVQIDQNGLNLADIRSFFCGLLITFIVYVSLRRAFCGMLSSMSKVKLDECENISDSLSQTLRPTTEPKVSSTNVIFNIGAIFKKYEIHLNYLFSILKTNISKRKVIKCTKLTSFEDRLIFFLSVDRLFKFGSAILEGNTQSATSVLGVVFQNMVTKNIENGQSEQKLQTLRIYGLNWGLLAGLATSVFNYLRGSVYQNQIIDLSFENNKYKNLAGINVVHSNSIVSQVEIIVSPEDREDG
jgi:hypothetical protein